MKHVAIVGAGLAGFTVARRLRELDFQGAISVFGNEAAAPYDRPPLSKDILKGEKTADDVRLWDRAFYEERDIQLHVSVQVTRISPEDRTVEIGPEKLGYDALVLATGATVRPPTRLDDTRPARHLRFARTFARAGAGASLPGRKTRIGHRRGVYRPRGGRGRPQPRA